jgi:insertion element IS1 protein InsB
MKKLSVFRATRYYIDNRRSSRKYIPASKHIVGKADTRKTERKNLNFRTRLKRLNRKTICFSRDEKIHDNVLGMYINRYYFQNGRCVKSA